MNKIKGKYKSSRRPCLRIDGEVVVEEARVAEAMGRHLEVVSSDQGYDQAFLQIKHTAEIRELNFNVRQHTKYNEPFTVMELKTALKSSSNTAPGEDKISYPMLRHLSESALEFLLYMYNVIWRTCDFPGVWRDAVVLPFFKPGKDPTVPESYRPIALTSCVCKLMEKMVNGRLMHVLEKSNVISPYQYGFRKMRSCEDTLARLECDIRQAFKKGQHLVAVLFDIEKAYDKAWRYHILRKLHQCNIRGSLGKFILNYLRNRRFRVKIGSHRSAYFEQQQGVPQGGVLSCSLFALAINDIVGDVPGDIQKSLYVDDLALYYASSRLPVIERKLQLAINQISKWASSHGVLFSKTKCVAVHFHRGRGLPGEPSLTLNGQPIRFKPHARFLGLVFDQRLTWEEHVRTLKGKSTQALGILKCLSHMEWGADRTTLLRLYRSLVRPMIDFASHIYSSGADKHLGLINSVHNEALRICTGAFRSSPIQSLCADAGEPPIQYRRQELGLRHYVRLKRLPGTPAHDAVYDDNLAETYNMENRQYMIPFAHRVARLYRELDMPDLQVLPYQQQLLPPWQLPEDIVCDVKICTKKAGLPAMELKQKFLEHSYIYHAGTTPLYTDGSRTSNGTACAFVTPFQERASKVNSSASSYTAELYGILSLLNEIDDMRQRRYTVYTDCQSAIDAIQCVSSVHPIVSKIQEWVIRMAARRKHVQFCWSPSHVAIAGNERADLLAKACADRDEPLHYALVPSTDMNGRIRTAVIAKWQNEWASLQNNKLRAIKETTRAWVSSANPNRKVEIALARLRIGHTRLTHKYLMEGQRNQPPVCSTCLHEQLTVKHIIVECPSYTWARGRYFRPGSTMSDILGDRNIDIPNVITFLRIIDVLDKL